MNRPNLMHLAILIIILEVGGSFALSLWIAERLARAQMSEMALAYARDVRSRSEGIGDQVSNAMQRLTPLRAEPPCSEHELAEFRAIDLSSDRVQAMGRVVDGKLSCSSYGRHEPPLSLGRVDYVSPAKVRFHLAATFPFAAGREYLVLERDGFAAIVHKALPLDVSSVEPGVALAIVARREGMVLSERGGIDSAWWQRDPARDEFTFVDAGSVVAVSRSRGYDLIGVAALPPGLLHAKARDIAWLLVPLGGLGGAALALVVLLFARQQSGLPALIRSGLRRREFFVHYQPIVDLRTHQWVGAEVLLRWRRDDQLIRPDLFIAAAEESGLIGSVTRRVAELVEPALAQIAGWPQPFYFSINLAAADLHDPAMLGVLDDLVKRAGADPSRLRVEVTERGFARADDARELVRAMRAQGFRVSIDDFGTGYSSLAYLESFELDCLKIDKRFVDTLDVEAVTSNVIGHIIDMGRSLELEMVAEGIEHEAQAEALRNRGVAFGQGWLYARPMPFEELSTALRDVGTPAA